MRFIFNSKSYRWKIWICIMYKVIKETFIYIKSVHKIGLWKVYSKIKLSM